MESKWFTRKPGEIRFRPKDHTDKGWLNATNIQEAFDKSIEHWELAVQGFETLYTMQCCGLCDLYINTKNEQFDMCAECPICIKTGRDGCDGTPYEKWRSVSSRESKAEYAQQELEFLKELRKELYGTAT